MSRISAADAETRFGEQLQRELRGGVPNLDSVKRSVAELRQLQQSIRKRSRGRFALSAAEVRSAIGHGRK